MAEPAQLSPTCTVRVYESEFGQILVTEWSTGEQEVAIREVPGATWGPPLRKVSEERS